VAAAGRWVGGAAVLFNVLDIGPEGVRLDYTAMAATRYGGMPLVAVDNTSLSLAQYLYPDIDRRGNLMHILHNDLGPHHLRTHAHTHTHARTHTHTQCHAHARTHTHTQTRTHRHARTHTHTHTHTQTHTGPCIRTYIHRRMCTHRDAATVIHLPRAAAAAAPHRCD
jgi:hypothetical protein